jgi:hypothetical protein
MKRSAIVLEWIVVGLMATVSVVGTLFVTGYAIEDLGAARGWGIFLAFAAAIVALSLVARMVPTVGAWVLGALSLLAVGLPLWGVIAFDSYRAFLDSIGPVPGVSLLVLLAPLAVLGLSHPAIAGSLMAGTGAAAYATFLATISGEPWLGLGATLTTSSTILVTPMLVGGILLLVAAFLVHSEAVHHHDGTVITG